MSDLKSRITERDSLVNLGIIGEYFLNWQKQRSKRISISQITQQLQLKLRGHFQTGNSNVQSLIFHVQGDPVCEMREGGLYMP